MRFAKLANEFGIDLPHLSQVWNTYLRERQSIGHVEAIKDLESEIPIIHLLSIAISNFTLNALFL